MKVKSIPSAWMRRDGQRLDCGPYMSGALEAKIRLEEMACEKVPLRELTAGYEGGIYNGPHFSRTFVDSPEHGVPFLGSSAMLQADLTSLPLLRRRDAESPKLAYLRVYPGMTLISCSGTIGRMIYARPDMDGMWTSQHIMKVVPDTTRVKSGYVFAFLSSKYGVPMVTSGTYGSIIQSIEPEHISKIPVPRLGDTLESRIHRLIEDAAQLRSAGAVEIAQTLKMTNELLHFPADIKSAVSDFSTNSVLVSNLNRRFDAPYHSKVATDAVAAVIASGAPVMPMSKVLKRYFKPPMFKRLWVDSSSYGRQFISGVDAYRYEAESLRYVSYKTANFDEFILKDGMVIFQAAGQIYGLFGRPLFVSGWLSGLFAADDLYRLEPRTDTDGGYLFAFLKTSVGQTLIKRQASGNSIPRVWDPHIRDISIPWPDEVTRKRIGQRTIDAHLKMEHARIAETDAIRLLEDAIEDAP